MSQTQSFSPAATPLATEGGERSRRPGPAQLAFAVARLMVVLDAGRASGVLGHGQVPPMIAIRIRRADLVTTHPQELL